MAEQNKDIFDLSEQEFFKYFKEKLIPNYDGIKKSKNPIPVNIAIGCSSIMLVFLIFILIIFLIAVKKNSIPTFYFIFMLAFLTIGIIKHISVILRASKFKKINIPNSLLKEDIFNRLGFKHLNCSLLSSNKNYEEIQKVNTFFGEILNKSFCSFANIEELFQGVYHNLPFTILDLFEVNNKQMFYRNLLAVKINKNISSEVCLYDKGEISKTRPIINQMQNTANFSEVINLEDVNFMQRYKIYAQDQVEARYLLTTSFMERLLQYKKLKNCGVDILFTSKYSNFYNLFIYIETGRKMFELPDGDLKYISQNPKFFYNILLEIKDIMQITEALKLDQDIGL